MFKQKTEVAPCRRPRRRRSTLRVKCSESKELTPRKKVKNVCNFRTAREEWLRTKLEATTRVGMGLGPGSKARGSNFSSHLTRPLPGPGKLANPWERPTMLDICCHLSQA